MARTYDRNRHRKIYPINRKSAVPAVAPVTTGITMETKSLSFSNSITQTYSFTQTYTSAPIVIATSNSNVNVYIASISTTQVVIRVSEAFTGVVYLQITAS